MNLHDNDEQNYKTAFQHDLLSRTSRCLWEAWDLSCPSMSACRRIDQTSDSWKQVSRWDSSSSYGVRKRTAVFPRAETFLPHFPPRSKCFFSERSVRATQHMSHSTYFTTVSCMLAKNRHQNLFPVEVNQPSCRFATLVVGAAINLVCEAFFKFLSAGTEIFEQPTLETPQQASFSSGSIDFDDGITRNCLNCPAMRFSTIDNAFFKAQNSRKSLFRLPPFCPP